jgi:hypothetical protein
MAPKLYAAEVETKTKKPRTDKQIAAFDKARATLAEKRKLPKEVPKEIEEVEKKVEIKVEVPTKIVDENDPPAWFKTFIKEVRERQVKRAPPPPQSIKIEPSPPEPIKQIIPKEQSVEKPSTENIIPVKEASKKVDFINPIFSKIFPKYRK